MFPSWTLVEPFAHRAQEHAGRPLVETCRDEGIRRVDGRHRVLFLLRRPHDETCGCDDRLEEHPVADVVRVIGIPDVVGGRIRACDASPEAGPRASHDDSAREAPAGHTIPDLARCVTAVPRWDRPATRRALERRGAPEATSP